MDITSCRAIDKSVFRDSNIQLPVLLAAQVTAETCLEREEDQKHKPAKALTIRTIHHSRCEGHDRTKSAWDSGVRT